MEQVLQPHTFDSSLSCLDACLLACNPNSQTALVREPDIVPFVPIVPISASGSSATLEQEPRAPKSLDESASETTPTTSTLSKNQTSIEQKVHFGPAKA